MKTDEIVLGTTIAEFDKLWEEVDRPDLKRKPKNITVNRKLLQKFLMDHSEALAKLEDNHVEVKQDVGKYSS